MTVTLEGGGPLAAPLDALKAYLCITRDEDDALLTDLIRAATDMAERFTGQVMIARTAAEVINACREWRRLSLGPVRGITGVSGIPADGSEFALPVEAYAIDIDGNGDGWVRVLQPGAAGRIRVTYEAGMAEDVEGVPDGIRHGIVRLAGEYHARREGLEARPPASVAALWRPWRRVRLS